MKASVLYRVASILLVHFAAGHTLGFQTTKPAWGVGPLIESMREIHFLVQGFSRTYRSFYIGFGFFVAALLLFTAIVCSQLGSPPPEALLLLSVVERGLAVCFAVVTILSWKYFFVAPMVFSIAFAVCLIVAGRLTWKRSQN